MIELIETGPAVEAFFAKVRGAAELGRQQAFAAP